MRNIITITLLAAILCIQCHKQKEQSTPAPEKTTPDKTAQQDTINRIKPQTEEDSIITEKVFEDTVWTEQEEIETTATSQLWQKYRTFREESKKAFNNSEFQEAITNLKLAAKYAQQLGRDDLVAWQYNNIAYYSILEFKGLTNYDYRLHQLRTIDNPDKKEEYLEETKTIFRKNLKILTDAEEFLEKAYKIDENYNDQNRTDKIYSNLKFIDWVKNFIKH
ncbi:MAG: hypothetical protein ACLFQM_01935 [Fidelibacterota bacterium]